MLWLSLCIRSRGCDSSTVPGEVEGAPRERRGSSADKPITRIDDGRTETSAARVQTQTPYSIQPYGGQSTESSVWNTYSRPVLHRVYPYVWTYGRMGVWSRRAVQCSESDVLSTSEADDVAITFPRAGGVRTAINRSLPPFLRLYGVHQSPGGNG